MYALLELTCKFLLHKNKWEDVSYVFLCYNKREFLLISAKKKFTRVEEDERWDILKLQMMFSNCLWA